MKRILVVGISLFILSLTATAALVSSNIVEIGFPYLFRFPDNYSKDLPNETDAILAIETVSYNKSTNELFVAMEFWTETGFSYFGNVHPFLIEIVDSKELRIINSQCFCEKIHQFPKGFSYHNTTGWLATKAHPQEFIESNYPLPESITIRVQLENNVYSDTFLVSLSSSKDPTNEADTILTIQTASYNKLTNQLDVTMEFWSETGLSYFGNVHPFLIEIINSEDLTIINSQCFCVKTHQFPEGASYHTTTGWFATKANPQEFIETDYPLPESIMIRVQLENYVSSETILVILD